MQSGFCRAISALMRSWCLRPSIFTERSFITGSVASRGPVWMLIAGFATGFRDWQLLGEQGFEPYRFSRGCSTFSLRQKRWQPFQIRATLCIRKAAPPLPSFISFTAEAEGFEPSNRFPRCRFSKPVPSTTQPRFQVCYKRTEYSSVVSGFVHLAPLGRYVPLAPSVHSATLPYNE